MSEGVDGRFGEFGRSYVPETLMAPLAELAATYASLRKDGGFQEEVRGWLREYAGRPTPLTYARRLSASLGHVRIYLKREDLAHTGAHKINNTIGQALLARRMGKRRLIAETGAGQHGVATATAAACLGMECTVYMGERDMERQSLNVFRMKLLGAEVIPVGSGSRTLKDAINEAMRDWVAQVKTTHYVLGSVLGPHPYPTMVRDFQRVIGEEAREQILAAEEGMPDAVIACVGGGSNAIGIFSGFMDETGVALTGVEAGGEGTHSAHHAARFATGCGSPGVLHGTYTYLLQDDDGQIRETHSVSAGLDYPAVGPEHADLFARGRASYVSVTDDEALEAFQMLSQTEGIIPALESAHAIAYACKMATVMPSGTVIIVNVSGRGDKDVDTVRGWVESSKFKVPSSNAEIEGGRRNAGTGPSSRVVMVAGNALTLQAREARWTLSRAAETQPPWLRPRRVGGGPMSTRLRSIMKALRDGDRAGFIPYITAGDPSVEWTENYIRILAEAGADVVEVGVPFSDPVADGPVNQRSSERALRNRVTLRAVLDLVARVRSEGCVIPIVLFTYYNPLLRMGVETFARRVAEAGADGALVLDLPMEESVAYLAAMRASGVDTVFLAAPTSPPERLRAIDRGSTAFVYYVSRLGVTGVRDQLPESLGAEIQRLRRHVNNPIAVGFGISTADQAAAVASYADAVVMGSVLVRFIEEYDPDEAGRRIGELARETVRRLKQARSIRAQEAK